MATKVLSNDFMQDISMKDAWKELSSDFGWSEALLEKYQDKVSWDEISGNSNIRWTIPMIQKFQKKINWERLSECADENTLTESFIEAFKDKWDWNKLSNNNNVLSSQALIDKYADRWNWEEIIDSYFHNVYDYKPIEFYEKYKEYIPVSKLQNTYLWRCIVEQRAKQLAEEITA